jgi:cold shock CspA family protein
MEKREGRLQHWTDEKGFGIVIARTGDGLERFFLRVTQIVKCDVITPKRGMKVLFEARPPRKVGQLAMAVNAELTIAPLVAPVEPEGTETGVCCKRYHYHS